METDHSIPCFITYSLCDTRQVTQSLWRHVYWIWAAWSQLSHMLIHSGDLVPGIYLVLVSNQNEDW